MQFCRGRENTPLFAFPAGGRGCAPALAFFARYASSHCGEGRERQWRGGFTVSLSHFDLGGGSPSCFAHQVPHTPLLRKHLCGGAALCGAGDFPLPSPRGAQDPELFGVLWQKEKAYVLRRKPLCRYKHGDNTTSANGSSMD